MKLQISTASAEALARLAVTARIVGGVLVDMPNLLNSGWLAILIGAALSFPLVYSVHRIRVSNQHQPIPLPRPLYAAFFVIAV